jgi:hypothetical protein
LPVSSSNHIDALDQPQATLFLNSIELSANRAKLANSIHGPARGQPLRIRVACHGRLLMRCLLDTRHAASSQAS